MKQRKLIACIMNCPENVYQQRLTDGLQARCELYGYDLAIFSPLVNSVHFYKDFLHAEFNLLELINFELFDAVVVVSLPLVGMGDATAFVRVRELLKSRCKKPVVCLDLPMDDHSTVYTDDTVALSAITAHILDVHKCEKIYFLAGAQTEGVVDGRLLGFKNELERRGLPIEEAHIFYGDFWYTSGTELAERILSGELEKPDAVICASDHMALGLMNRLIRGGISVPDEIIITGFDATQEALINEVSLTSYTPDNRSMAEEAIDRIRAIIEPDKPIAPLNKASADGIFIGMSCGCHVDYRTLIRRLGDSLYKVNRDFDRENVLENEDLYSLMESYMMEALTECKSPEECLGNIYAQTYLIKPFDHFYLCLRENWLDTDSVQRNGYPARMRVNIHAIPPEAVCEGAEYFHCDDDRCAFPSELMFPEMLKDHQKPCLYHFIPVHFQENTLGYAVLQCELSKRVKVTGVLRNWMRNINNALQMARVNHRLMDDSEIDSLTGLKNRRGMEHILKGLLSEASRNDYCYAIVLDLDGLKHINDNYGHTEGDFAITSVANAVARITESNEVSIRAGGDEFFLLGVSAHCTEKTLIDKVSKYREFIAEINRASNKPYEVSASVGFSFKKLSEIKTVDDIIREADKYMYLCKSENKKHRR